MKIIDAHVHFSEIAVFKDTARLYSGVDYSAEGLRAECSANNVVGLVAMGLSETIRYGFPDGLAPTPMGCDLPDTPDFLKVCLGINPLSIDLQRLEDALPDAAGIKIYAGYYHFHVHDPVYDPVYRLAEKYGKPVVIHSGDTYSERGLLEYSRPLHVDRIAVKYRDVNFVIAHMGDPWIMEACEIAYKNSNIFMDLSGLAVGGEEVNRIKNEPLLKDRFRQGLLFLNQYQKILYGTDWPLVEMATYIDFCKALVPEENWQKVFYENAAGLFLFHCGEENNVPY
jgi:hypothetical protein